MSQSHSQRQSLDWLNLPIDVIHRQFDNLSLNDIQTLTTIENIGLYNTILNYIDHNIKARKYDYDDLSQIYKFGGKFKDIVPINFSKKYIEYVHFTCNDDNNIMKVLYINSECKKLLEFMERIADIDDVHSIISYGEVCAHIVKFMTYKFAIRGEISTCIFHDIATWHIIEEDFSNEEIGELDRTIINDGMLNYQIIYDLFDDGVDYLNQ